MEVEIMLPAPNRPLEVARQVVQEHHHHHDGLRLRFWRGAFWRWHRSHWREAEDAELRAKVYRFTGHAVYMDDKLKEKPWAPTKHKVADVLDALRAVTHLGEQVDQPAWVNADTRQAIERIWWPSTTACSTSRPAR
jgi:putative DNA primase/helicase